MTAERLVHPVPKDSTGLASSWSVSKPWKTKEMLASRVEISVTPVFLASLSPICVTLEQEMSMGIPIYAALNTISEVSLSIV